MGWDVKASAVAAGEWLPSADQLKALAPSASQFSTLVMLILGASALYAVLISANLGARKEATHEACLIACTGKPPQVRAARSTPQAHDRRLEDSGATTRVA